MKKIVLVLMLIMVLFQSSCLAKAGVTPDDKNLVGKRYYYSQWRSDNDDVSFSRFYGYSDGWIIKSKIYRLDLYVLIDDYVRAEGWKRLPGKDILIYIPATNERINLTIMSSGIVALNNSKEYIRTTYEITAPVLDMFRNISSHYDFLGLVELPNGSQTEFSPSSYEMRIILDEIKWVIKQVDNM